MILHREILITKEKEYLLDSINLLIVPLFNVDVHKRSSKYNRINQNGLEDMGLRTSAQNYNLNRDWMRAESPVMQEMLLLVSIWNPDFIIDTHSADGTNYHYTVTYQVERFAKIYNIAADWLPKKFVLFSNLQLHKKDF